MKENEIKQTEEEAFKELFLNIKHQNIKINEFITIGYEYDKGIYVFTLIIPKKMLK